MLLNCGSGEDAKVPWTARRSDQSILKEISPEYSLEGLDVKVDAPILWPPDVKNQLIGKDLVLGKIESTWRGDRGWDGWMASSTQRTWVWASSRRWWSTGKLGILQSIGFRHDLVMNSKLWRGRGWSENPEEKFWVLGNNQIRSVAQSCPTLCDPMNRSTPGLPVHHQLPNGTT